jgi:hypothetical protein
MYDDILIWTEEEERRRETKRDEGFVDGCGRIKRSKSSGSQTGVAKVKEHTEDAGDAQNVKESRQTNWLARRASYGWNSMRGFDSLRLSAR